MTGKKSQLAQNAAVVSRPRSCQGNTHSTPGEHAPEEVEEPKRLDDDAHERPLEEDEEDAADEARRPAQLLFPREEVERLGGPDDECQAREEQDLRGGGAGAGRGVRYGRSAGAGKHEGRTFPRARRAPSKKRMTLRSMKRPPKDVSATPISGWAGTR
ncbi:hypothetical protein TRAPUB_9178 [Trametes pubescens]|uniref:Uncharacterized protein n=1 Tax=Trametes pubescens TaxID=154538 RepID=A0A1M2W378_TRAPU|nr:hypothetical protein TRAPUB_9178 [Trametes pubescens]